MQLVRRKQKNNKHADPGSFLPLKLRFPGLPFLLAAVMLLTPMATSPLWAINADQPARVEKDYEKALISFHNHENKKAVIHLKNALKGNPVHLPSRILMAEILIEQGNGAGAEIELDFSRERGADKDRLILLYGRAYILQGKNKYLLSVIHNGNREDNIETEISYLRGRAYFGDKKLANAKRSYQEALDRNPLFHKAKIGLAQVAAIHKQYGLALQYIDSALSTGEPNPGAWLLKAKIFKLRGFNKEALKAINTALSLDDSNVLSRLTRAALYIDQKDFDKASGDVDIILKKIPREPRARYLKAVITAAQGNFSESKSNMTEIINILRSVPPEVMKANPTYYYLSALTNFQFGNLDEAREHLQKYLKVERNDISAMRLLGALEIQAGDFLAANIVLLRANRDQPDNPTILTMLGMAYLELGNNEKANYYLEQVTRLLPGSSEGLTNLARGRMAIGSFDEAIKNLLKAEQHNFNSLDVKLLLVKAYQQSRQYDKAITIVRKLKDQEPDNAALLTLYGTAMGLAGNHSEARESYQQALTLDQNNITSLIHLSRMDVVAGNSDIALDSLHKQLERSPDNPVLMQELGNIYKRLDDIRNALIWYEKAYLVNMKNFAALSNLVEGHILNNDSKSAIEATSEFIRRFPKHADAYILSGKLYQRTGNPARAIKNFKLAADYAVKRGDALLVLANAQLDNNDRSAARKTLHKAVAWDPELTEAYVALIKMAISDSDRESGFALIQNLRAITDNSDPAPDILTGDLHLALKDFSKAEQAFLSALKTGDNPLAVMGLNKAYQKSGQINKAIAALEDWHGKYPEDLRVALSLGTAYKRAGQIKKAVDFHERLLESSPDMPLILNNAATTNFTAGHKDRAREYARRANEIMPDNAAILDTLAWIESRTGKPDVALPLLRKALVLQFSDPEIKYHLAITLDMLNRRTEAQKLLAEAVASRSDFPEKPAARQTLKLWQEG